MDSFENEARDIFTSIGAFNLYTPGLDIRSVKARLVLLASRLDQLLCQCGNTRLLEPRCIECSVAHAESTRQYKEVEDKINDVLSKEDTTMTCEHILLGKTSQSDYVHFAPSSLTGLKTLVEKVALMRRRHQTTFYTDGQGSHEEWLKHEHVIVCYHTALVYLSDAKRITRPTTNPTTRIDYKEEKEEEEVEEEEEDYKNDQDKENEFDEKNSTPIKKSQHVVKKPIFFENGLAYQIIRQYQIFDGEDILVWKCQPQLCWSDTFLSAQNLKVASIRETRIPSVVIYLLGVVDYVQDRGWRCCTNGLMYDFCSYKVANGLVPFDPKMDVPLSQLVYWYQQVRTRISSARERNASKLTLRIVYNTQRHKQEMIDINKDADVIALAIKSKNVPDNIIQLNDEITARGQTSADLVSESEHLMKQLKMEMPMDFNTYHQHFFKWDDGSSMSVSAVDAVYRIAIWFNQISMSRELETQISSLVRYPMDICSFIEDKIRMTDRVYDFKRESNSGMQLLRFYYHCFWDLDDIRTLVAKEVGDSKSRLTWFADKLKMTIFEWDPNWLLRSGRSNPSDRAFHIQDFKRLPCSIESRSFPDTFRLGQSRWILKRMGNDFIVIGKSKTKTFTEFLPLKPSDATLVSLFGYAYAIQSSM